MKISINDEQLQTLLKDRKSYISKSYKQSIPYLSFALSLWLASFCAEFKDWGIIKAKYTILIYYSVIIISFVIGIYYFVSGLLKPYNHDNLYREIIELSKSHNFAILMLRDEKKYKYLLVKDKRWSKCRLFLNIKLIDNPTQSNAMIKKRLSDIFDIEQNNIDVDYVSTMKSRKWSVSDKTIKEYTFYFYNICIKNPPSYMEKASFSLKDNTYYWTSLEQMERNGKLMKLNRDVIEEVKRLRAKI